MIVCGNCGAEVGWGLPRPEDPCLDCGLPIGSAEGREQHYAGFLLDWSRDGIPRGETQEAYAVRVGRPGMVSL